MRTNGSDGSVKHLGCVGDALLTTGVNSLQILLSPNSWPRVLRKSDDRGNRSNSLQWLQNQVCLGGFGSPMVPALQDLSLERLVWKVWEASPRHSCSEFPSSSGLVPRNQEPHSGSAFPLLGNKVLLLCFPGSRNQHNMGRNNTGIAGNVSWSA